MKLLLDLIRPDTETSPTRRYAHRVWLYGWLTLMGVGIYLTAMLLSAYSYTPFDNKGLFFSYFSSPALIALNLFVPLCLIYLGFFLFRRPWAAYLLAALPCMALALSNYYKIRLRGDPVLATDLKLLRTAGGIVGQYTLELSKPVLAAIIAFGVMLLFSVAFLRKEPLYGRTRPLGVLICMTLLIGAYFSVYTDVAVYDTGTDNSDLFVSWSDTEVYLSKGTIYPFIYSIQDLFPDSPEGYVEVKAEQLLAQYQDEDIPAEEKVTVVGVMLEAFCDLTDYPMLAQFDKIAEVYAPLHELEGRSVSGDLLTNIFAGGTVDTEWGFLTGYSRHEDFLSDTDSFVWYFKEQGYDTFYRHPGYNWFYDRENVNSYLGFDESVFQENGFSDLISMNDALYYSDAVLYDYLLDDLDARGAEDMPLFLFSVTYQNHGPYTSDTYWKEYITEKETGWSYETCCIINNYLSGIERTVNELCRFVNELEARDEPIVFVFFGDHKPWLGNGSSVYTEIGVNIDNTTLEGFENYFSTPYGIYANSAAKEVLANDFVGDGGSFSPCYLMAKLFDECGWDGPAFMQLQRSLREEMPLIHTWGYFLYDGELTGNIPEELQEFYQCYRYVEYYREKNFSTAEAS